MYNVNVNQEDDGLLASLILINWCSQRWAVTQSPEAGLGHWPHLVTVTRIMMLSQDKCPRLLQLHLMQNFFFIRSKLSNP